MNFRRNKFRVAKPEARTWRGRVYASKAEMLYAQLLDSLLRGGELKSVEEQPTVTLGPSGIKYTPDFLITDARGKQQYIDVKGVETQAFRLKARLWKVHGPGRLVIVKRSGKGWKVAREVAGGGGGA